jgi:hypothetical protein
MTPPGIEVHHGSPSFTATGVAFRSELVELLVILLQVRVTNSRCPVQFCPRLLQTGPVVLGFCRGANSAKVKGVVGDAKRHGERIERTQRKKSRIVYVTMLQRISYGRKYERVVRVEVFKKEGLGCLTQHNSRIHPRTPHTAAFKRQDSVNSWRLESLMILKPQLNHPLNSSPMKKKAYIHIFRFPGVRTLNWKLTPIHQPLLSLKLRLNYKRPTIKLVRQKSAVSKALVAFYFRLLCPKGNEKVMR